MPLLLTAIMAGEAGAQAHPPVTKPTFELSVLSAGGSVKAVGSWSTRIRRGVSMSIAPMNTVEISCSKVGMTCSETRAELMANADARPARSLSDGQKEHLALSTLRFTVTEWTAARITARSDTPDGDLMLRIVPSEKLVRLSYWNAKGAKDKDGQASGFMWELQ